MAANLVINDNIERHRREQFWDAILQSVSSRTYLPLLKLPFLGAICLVQPCAPFTLNSELQKVSAACVSKKALSSLHRRQAKSESLSSPLAAGMKHLRTEI